MKTKQIWCVFLDILFIGQHFGHNLGFVKAGEIVAETLIYKEVLKLHILLFWEPI